MGNWPFLIPKNDNLKIIKPEFKLLNNNVLHEIKLKYRLRLPRNNHR